MLTGCRREEIGGLRWDEIDSDSATNNPAEGAKPRERVLSDGVLTIPGARTKNHRELKLPLPQAALAILSSRAEGGREHIFGPRQGFRAWSYYTAILNGRIAGMEGRQLPPWRLHDLRRTMRTGLGRLGVALRHFYATGASIQSIAGARGGCPPP